MKGLNMAFNKPYIDRIERAQVREASPTVQTFKNFEVKCACGVEFTTPSGSTKRCAKCAAEHRKAYAKAYKKKKGK